MSSIVNNTWELRACNWFVDTENYGNYVFLPESIFRFLDRSRAKMPYFFELSTQSEIKVSVVVSVREFTASEHDIYIPSWIFNFLCIKDGERVDLRLIKNIRKAEYIKIQPQDRDFFQIPEYESCLEQKLSHYTVLEKDSDIVINIWDREYLIKILEIEREDNKENKENKVFEEPDLDSSTDISDDELEEEYQFYYDSEDEMEIDDAIEFYRESKEKESKEDIPENIVDIINTDIEVDIHNKFLEKELEKIREEEHYRLLKEREEKRKKQLEKTKKKEVEEKIKNHKSECKLTREELRKKRLEAFEKKEQEDK